MRLEIKGRTIISPVEFMKAVSMICFAIALYQIFNGIQPTTTILLGLVAHLQAQIEEIKEMLGEK